MVKVMGKNKIYTIEEYIQQGFTEKEAPLVLKTDKWFNHWDELSEKKKERYYIMIEYLGL